jgi:Holliday junction resolvase-like predicted endonuclease
VTDFQSRSSAVGRSYEDQVTAWLIAAGFTITGRNVRHESGIQMDIAAISPFGEQVAIECKASDESAPEQTRGMRRSDNRWKVLGYLWALRVWKQRGELAPRYMLFTSDMPEAGSVQRVLLDMAEALGDLTIVHVPFGGAA